MGNIPEFQTRRLASAVTPTLGADPQAGGFAGALSAGMQFVGEARMAKEAEKQKVLDVIEAESLLREFEGEMKGASEQIKTQFLEQPDDGVTEIGNAGEQLIKLKIDEIKNENVRAMFARGASTSLRNGNRQATAWATTQKVIRADENFTRVTIMQQGDLKAEPFVEGQPITQKFEEQLGYHEDRVKAAQALYGTQSAKKMQEGREGLSKSWLHGLMEKEPLVAKELLEKGYFTGLLDGEDIKAYQVKVKDKIEGWQEEVKFENLYQAFGQFKGLEHLWFRNELTIGAVDVAENAIYTTSVKDGKGGFITLAEARPELQQHINDIREAVATRKDLTFDEKAENLEKTLEFGDRIRRMGIDSDKLTAEATLEELIEIQGEIYRAMKNGQIDPAKAEYFLNQIQSPTTDSLENAKDGRWFSGFRKPTPESASYDTTEVFLRSGNFSEGTRIKLKGKILTKVIDAFSAIKEARASYGGEISIEEAESITEEAINEVREEESPLFGSLMDAGRVVRLRSGKILEVKKGSIKRIK